MSVKVYLAGPEVFLPNAVEIQKEKAALARAAGFTPLVPAISKSRRRPPSMNVALRSMRWTRA